MDFEEYLEIITYEEKLSNKDVLLESIPQFDYSDIKILGYELKESKYNEIINSIGYSYKYDELGLGWIKPQADIIISVSDSSYIDVFSSGYSNSLTINTPLSGVEEFAELGARPMNGEAEVTAFEYLQSSHSSVINFRKVNGIETTASQLGESWCGSSLPILLGDTYEKWCSIMGVDLLKQSSIVEREIEDHTEWGEKIERYNIVSESASSGEGIKIISYMESIPNQTVHFMTDYETSYYDYDMWASIEIHDNKIGSGYYYILAEFLDGTVQSVRYEYRMEN